MTKPLQTALGLFFLPSRWFQSPDVWPILGLILSMVKRGFGTVYMETSKPQFTACKQHPADLHQGQGR